MSNTWTLLWSPREIKNAHREGVLQVLGSNHFGRRPLRESDTVWVLYSPARGKVHAIGAVRVAPVMNRSEAVRRFGDELFDRKWFVRPSDVSAVPVREIDVSDVARRLVFVGPKEGKSTLRFGPAAPALGHQLRAMRQLTRESAALLAKSYRTGRPIDRDERKEFKAAATLLAAGDTKREILVRKEQSALRKIMFRDATHGRCELCQNEFPVGLLVAAHLKKRSKCTPREREDLTNIAPMCVLGCDALFERGMIRVENGRLIRRSGQSAVGRLERLLSTLHGRKVSQLWRRSEHYLKWHAVQA